MAVNVHLLTPPNGHKSLCSRNLVPDQTNCKTKRHFDTLLWTGNATSRNITGLEFKPDLVHKENW